MKLMTFIKAINTVTAVLLPFCSHPFIYMGSGVS